MIQLPSSLARTWFGTVGTEAAILVFGIGTGILAARLLGPADRGLLAVVLFWPGLFVALGFLSLGEAVVFRAGKTAVERRRFVGTVAALSLVLTIPVVAVGILVLPILLGAERAVHLPLATAYLCAFAPLNFLALALLAVDHAECRFLRYNLLRLVPSGVYLLGLLFLWALGAVSVATAIWASWLGTALTAAVRLWSWRQDLLAWPSWREAASLLRQGALFHGTTLVIVVSSQADRLILMQFFGDDDIGHYVVALTIATAGLGLVTNSVHTVLFPRLAAEPVRVDALAQLRLGLRRSTLFLVVGSLSAIVLIPFVLPLLFGAEFAEAVPLAVALVIAYVPLAVRQIIVRCLRAFGDARTGLWAEGLALAAFLLLVPLALAWGLIGVPLALLAANVVGLGVVCVKLSRRYRIATADWLLPSRAMLSDALALAGRLQRMALPAR